MLVSSSCDGKRCFSIGGGNCKTAGDGTCDAANNNADCDFDSGDCAASSDSSPPAVAAPEPAPAPAPTPAQYSVLDQITAFTTQHRQATLSIASMSPFFIASVLPNAAQVFAKSRTMMRRFGQELIRRQAELQKRKDSRSAMMRLFNHRRSNK